MGVTGPNDEGVQCGISGRWGSGGVEDQIQVSATHKRRKRVFIVKVYIVQCSNGVITPQ